MLRNIFLRPCHTTPNRCRRAMATVAGVPGTGVRGGGGSFFSFSFPSLKESVDQASQGSEETKPHCSGAGRKERKPFCRFYGICFSNVSPPLSSPLVCRSGWIVVVILCCFAATGESGSPLVALVGVCFVWSLVVQRRRQERENPAAQRLHRSWTNLDLAVPPAAAQTRKGVQR